MALPVGAGAAGRSRKAGGYAGCGNTPRIRAPGFHRVLAERGHLGQLRRVEGEKRHAKFIEKTENACPWADGSRSATPIPPP